MKKIIILTVIGLFLVPAAFSNTITVRGGYFMPRTQGGPDSLWTIELDSMSFKKSNYSNSFLGFSYEHFLTKQLSVAFTVDTYNRNKAGYYLDYVGLDSTNGYAFPVDPYGQLNDAYDVSHAFNVSITPIQVSLKLAPAGRRIKLIPYVGGGVGIYFWNADIRGEVIDFSQPTVFVDEELNQEVIGYPIYPADVRDTSRISIGYHAFGGFMFPIGNRMTLEAEVRYHFAKGNHSEDTFPGYEKFDLSGIALTAGLNYWF